MCSLQEDFTEFLLNVRNPRLAVSVTLSDCYGSGDSDPSFVEMLGRVLYHVTMNCYYVTADGKFHRDTSEYDMFFNALVQFSRKFLLK